MKISNGNIHFSASQNDLHRGNGVRTASVEQKLIEKFINKKFLFQSEIPLRSQCKKPYVSEYLIDTCGAPTLFTFFYVHKKKVLDLQKFSTSSFRWIFISLEMS